MTETLAIGVTGYSGQKFDADRADALLKEALDTVAAAHPGRSYTLLSGLTDVGIPALAYRQAAARGWRTVGVACPKAAEYECYPVDETTIVGSEWGDESETFLARCDVLVRVGGGGQAHREATAFADRGGRVYEYELDAIR